MNDGDVVLVRVANIEREAADVLSLELCPMSAGEQLPVWEPGAHLDLHAGNGQIRQYSLCGDPADRSQWRIAILRVPDGRGGSAWFHDELSIGDEIKVSGPRNNFKLEAAPSYVFIAGGIGITPILSMIDAANQSGVPWELAYGGRSRESMAFLDRFRGHFERVTIVPQNESGLIDIDAVLGEQVEGRRIYCCGPEPLIAAVEAAMADRHAEALHVERFRASIDDTASGSEFDVELAASGRQIHVAAGQSIIDALAETGVEVDFSCREGTCGTCETAVLSGIPEHRDSVLTPEEKDANDCMMICVGRCLQGPLVLDL
ncbi:MAG: oxidoreductase [Aeromicrobium sp.]|nr:oxidoreductase [Aeromicrobium sp.]